MQNPNKLLSDLVAFRTYAKFLPEQKRRESLSETISRNEQMHLDRFSAQKFAGLRDDIREAFRLVRALKVMPSMRGMQFAGQAILKNNVRQYNCAFRHASDVGAFAEILFLLLSGSGVGFSVQWRHVKYLPKVRLPRKEGYFAVHDSIEGWAQALDLLMEAYFLGRPLPKFDFFQISPKGTYLETTGARAPGPEPLKEMLEAVEARLKLAVGRQLRPIEVHDIICLISECVLAGGIRRAALISLFDRWDNEMLRAKTGQWWETHPYRARANNSVVLPRFMLTKEEFFALYKICRESRAGEPGFSWTNDPEMGFNPCHEIAQWSKQFCNVTTLNQGAIRSEAEFYACVRAAALLGTIQAAYTDFPFITDEWRQVTEREALIGVSFTGIADAGGFIQEAWLREGARQVGVVNFQTARRIEINVAARQTTGKPEGSSSAVLGSSSGIHARHAEHYLRTIRLLKDTALAQYLMQKVPELCEPEIGAEDKGIVIAIPQKSPDGAVVRTQETALQAFNRTLSYNRNWVAPGHRSGPNPHNISCSINVRDDEWDELCEAMWNNRADYSGISLFPYDGGTYKQAPFQECDRETYEKYLAYVKDVDLREVVEEVDATSRTSTVACGGGACEVL